MRVIPNRIELTSPEHASNGLYESYYFRGTSPDGLYAFWLKHNFLRYSGETDVLIENSILVFDRVKNSVTKAHQSARLSQQIFAELSRDTNWNNLSFRFENGGYFAIGPNRLEGKCQSVTWDFDLNAEINPYFHFSKSLFYRAGFPKKKILTHYPRVEFNGTLSMGDQSVPADQFVGMCGHNWGREHAYHYAYANIVEWSKNENAFFDGFSAKIRLGKWTSPFLSLASLRLGQDWYHFNNVLSAYRHSVGQADLKAWKVHFTNRTHSLDVSIDGTSALWADLIYDHPDHKRSQIWNTKFATALLVLRNKASGQIVRELGSGRAELETAIGYQSK